MAKKTDLASVSSADWGKIKQWLDACNAKAKEIIDRYDDVTIGFFAAALFDKADKEKFAGMVNDRAKFDIGYNAGLVLAPFIKPAIMSWLLGVIGSMGVKKAN